MTQAQHPRADIIAQQSEYLAFVPLLVRQATLRMTVQDNVIALSRGETAMVFFQYWVSLSTTVSNHQGTVIKSSDTTL